MKKILVREMKRTPKDIAKFVSPQQAAKLLRMVTEAVEKASPDSRWHFHLKVRVASTERTR